MNIPYDNLPPQHIIEAAQLVSQFMAQRNHDYWELCGVCDRKYAFDYHRQKHIDSAKKGTTQLTAPKDHEQS